MGREESVIKILDVMPKYMNGMSDSDVAEQVLDGRWGNGLNRKFSLEQANYDYNSVQRSANRMVVRKSSKRNSMLFILKLILVFISISLVMYVIDRSTSAYGIDIKAIQALIVSILLIIATIAIHKIYYILGVIYGFVLLLQYPKNKLNREQINQVRRIATRYDNVNQYISACGRRYEKYSRR